jgi:hypothetical protein
MRTSGCMKDRRWARSLFSDLNAVALRFHRQADVTSGFHPQQNPKRLAGVGVKEFKSIAIIGAGRSRSRKNRGSVPRGAPSRVPGLAAKFDRGTGGSRLQTPLPSLPLPRPSPRPLGRRLVLRPANFPRRRGKNSVQATTATDRRRRCPQRAGRQREVSAILRKKWRGLVPQSARHLGGTGRQSHHAARPTAGAVLRCALCPGPLPGAPFVLVHFRPAAQFTQ